MAAFRLDCSIEAGELDTLDVAGLVALDRLTAQDEAVVLVQAWEHDGPDPCEELAALRRIAANSLAVSMVVARGIDIAKRIAILENITAAFPRKKHIDTYDDAIDPDAPPRGADWCRNGCQPLYGMDCGVCGYDGPGVRVDQTDSVAEYCCHCRTRTYQSHEGICSLCGKDAEDAGEAAPSTLRP